MKPSDSRHDLVIKPTKKWNLEGLKSVFSKWCASKIWGEVSEVRFKKNSTLWKRRKTTASAIFWSTGAWGLSKKFQRKIKGKTYISWEGQQRKIRSGWIFKIHRDVSGTQRTNLLYVGKAKHKSDFLLRILFVMVPYILGGLESNKAHNVFVWFEIAFDPSSRVTWPNHSKK